VRPDRLTRGQCEALGLVDPPLREQELRKGALGLAQRRAVLQRGEDPDRLAEEPLGAGDLSLVPRGPAGEVERAAEHPRRTGLGEVLAGRLERGLGVVELAPVQV